MIYLKLLEVLALGFFCGLIPGPVVTALFTETIRAGHTKAKRIIWMAAVGELVMSIVCVSAFSFLNAQSVVFSALGIFGAILLLSVSVDLWKISEIHEEEPLFSNKRIFFIALLNGMAWVFWVTVCTPQAVQMGALLHFGQWLFILFFEIGWVCSTFCLAFLFAYFRPYFQSNQKIHLLFRSVAIVFIFFSLKLAYGSVKQLL